MTPLDFRFMGIDLSFDPSGALFDPASGWLAVADLHLEKGSAAAARGRPLPPYDTRATLDRLEDVVDRLRPTRLLSVGDAFHDAAAGSRLLADDAERLRALAARVDLVWITGNHDPHPPAGIGGRAAPEILDGPLVFRHAAIPGASGEVSGHLHPAATVSTGATTVRGRCLVHDETRLILPAFGAYAGGLDVQDPAIRDLLGPRFEVLLMSGGRVFRVPGERTRTPRRRDPRRAPQVI